MRKSFTRFLFNHIFICRYPEVILWWQGGDVERLYSYPLGISRIKTFLFRILMKRFTKHPNLQSWVNTERMVPMLKEFGYKNISYHPVPVKEEFIEYSKTFKPLDHDKFNVLFYLKNQWYHRHERFIYGYEYYEILEMYYKEDPLVNFITVDGTKDMTQIYPVVDCYVKFNVMPHNDRNLISKECELLGIPEKAFDIFDKSKYKSIEEMIEWINTNKDIWLTRKEKKRN